MRQLLRLLLIMTGLLMLWQATIVLFHLPAYILPSPWQVAVTWFEQFNLIMHEAAITLTEALLGLLFGTLLGCFAALAMVFFHPLTLWLLPILIISQAVPTFAIAPLFVLWFGYGMLSKIATTIIMLFFPITSAFYDGLHRTPAQWNDMAKTMGARKWRFFYYIRMRAALPYLASGLKIAAVIAPIGAIVGEWVGASQGLGFLMLNANARMQIDLMFAALFTLTCFSLLFYFIMDRAMNAIVFWRAP